MHKKSQELGGFLGEGRKRENLKYVKEVLGPTSQKKNSA